MGRGRCRLCAKKLDWYDSKCFAKPMELITFMACPEHFQPFNGPLPLRERDEDGWWYWTDG
jgi:hypothetical protein